MYLYTGIFESSCMVLCHAVFLLYEVLLLRVSFSGKDGISVCGRVIPGMRRAGLSQYGDSLPCLHFVHPAEACAADREGMSGVCAPLRAVRRRFCGISAQLYDRSADPADASLYPGGRFPPDRTFGEASGLDGKFQTDGGFAGGRRYLCVVGGIGSIVWKEKEKGANCSGFSDVLFSDPAVVSDFLLVYQRS